MAHIGRSNKTIKKVVFALLILSGLNILRHTARDFYVFALRPTVKPFC
jgi:hypothetical protein